jgi:hypothetical protein
MVYLGGFLAGGDTACEINKVKTWQGVTVENERARILYFKVLPQKKFMN